MTYDSKVLIDAHLVRQVNENKQSGETDAAKSEIRRF